MLPKPTKTFRFPQDWMEQERRELRRKVRIMVVDGVCFTAMMVTLYIVLTATCVAFYGPALCR